MMGAWKPAAALFIGACLSAAPVHAQDARAAHAKARWEKSIAEAEAAWASDKFAILKIDDAVYLRPGQTAWLVAPRPPAGKTAWRLESVFDPMLVVTYTSDEALFVSEGKTVSFDPKSGATMALDEQHEVRAQETQIAPDEMGLRLFSYNQEQPAAKAFSGLDWYPYNPALVIQAAFKAEPATPVKFETSRGWEKQFYRVGAAEFRYQKKLIRLPLYADSPTGEGGLSALFTDRTTGKTTYSVGRYLDAESEGGFPPKRVTLDFNYAYNPNCARSPHYNCPYALDSLPVSIEAGEKSPPEHE